MRKKKRYTVILLGLLFVIGIYIRQKMNHDLQVEGTAAGKEIVVYQVNDVTKDKFEECWADAEYETNGIFDVGDSICLSFTERPDDAEIWEVLLNPQTKSSFYGKIGHQQISYITEKNTIRFQIPDNIATGLSSNPPKTDLRAYAAQVSVNDQKFIYTFLIETNSVCLPDIL